MNRPAREVEGTSVSERPLSPAPIAGPPAVERIANAAEPPAVERIANAETVLALQTTAGNHAVTTMLQRQPKTKTPDKSAPQADPVEDTWQALLAFSARATPELSRVGKKVEDYLGRYDAAYAKFAARLDKADKEAAAERKWADAMSGLIIGIGVGLATGGMYRAATIVGKLAHEIVDAAAGAGIQQALGGAPADVDFKPPAELHNDKVARGQLQELVRAWQALAIVQASTLALSNRRDAARAGHGDAKLAADFERLKLALEQTDRALTVFLTTVDTPVLNRGEFRLEQDMWIKWMSTSQANAREMFRGGPVQERAREQRIWSRVTGPEREFFDQRGELMQQRSKEELARMGKLGAVGVMIVPPRPRTGRGAVQPGVMRIRGDAYSAAGRAVPQGGILEYVKVAHAQHTYLRPGEVVMVSETDPTGVVVDRLGPELAVSPTERQAALQMLGIKENEYEPEAAALLSPYIWNALQVLRDEPLKLSQSEDGVLVSHTDGSKLVLFAPLMPGDWRAGARGRDRVGARKVVLINVNPKIEARPAREPGIVVLTQSDAYSLAEEIREVLPKQPKPVGAR